MQFVLGDYGRRPNAKVAQLVINMLGAKANITHHQTPVAEANALFAGGIGDSDAAVQQIPFNTYFVPLLWIKVKSHAFEELIFTFFYIAKPNRIAGKTEGIVGVTVFNRTQEVKSGTARRGVWFQSELHFQPVFPIDLVGNKPAAGRNYRIGIFGRQGT